MVTAKSTHTHTQTYRQQWTKRHARDPQGRSVSAVRTGLPVYETEQLVGGSPRSQENRQPRPNVGQVVKRPHEGQKYLRGATSSARRHKHCVGPEAIVRDHPKCNARD
jgi:hypothetical protein